MEQMQRNRRNRQASSLLETVIGLFILSSAIIVFFTLFHSSLGVQSEIENRREALTIAQERIEDLRILALDYSTFAGSLSGEVGTRPAESNSAFEVETEIEALPDFFTPSEKFESSFAGLPHPDVYDGRVSDDRKRMPTSMLAARVTVRNPGSSAKPLSLTSYLREPRRLLESVEVNRLGPNIINYQERTHFEATAMDSDGNEITDIIFDWRVEPITGYGTLNQSRDGRFATLEFADYDLNGNPFQPPAGQCRVSATARVADISVKQRSGEIELRP